MLKKLLLFLLLFAGSISGQSNNTIDSLQAELSSNTVDSFKVKLLNNLANQYRISGDLKRAKSYIDSALFITNKTHWSYGKSMSYNNLAYINIYESDFEASMKNAVTALQIAEAANDKENLGFAYLYIGYVKLSIGETEEVLSYYQKSLSIRKELGNNYNLGYSYSYFGSYYNTIKNYDSSIYYHSLALIARLKTGDTRSIADSYLLIGSVLFKQKKYNEALKNYDFALEKYTVISDKRRLAETYRNYAEVYLHQNKLNTAASYLSKSLKIAHEIGAIENLIPIYNELAYLHEKQGDYKSAYKAVRNHIEYKDSTNNNSVFREVTKQILKYKTEKEKRIKELEYQNEKAIQEKNKAILVAKNKTQQYILFGAATLILILAAVAFLIAKTLKTTRIQKTVIEEQTKEIVDSITYAKRIQEAILPKNQFIKECLPESFIYYKPKDIVAGDFYWISKENGRIIFAVADCTGHGVPGAMVSVVCHNAIDRAMREYKLIAPNDILNKTREIVVKQLNNSENTDLNSIEKIRDGMDIALCVLNPKTNQIQYAGAYNPLWILRKGSNEIEEIKANRQSIGTVEHPKTYNMHTITLKKGDTVYIFSDGYIDQFGGEKGKKFMKKAFKKLLISMKEETMESQLNTLHTHFNNWKGNLEQVDDVCVIGVRI
ncbi:MAG: tetratricopeptide repeat protein [Flavobacteriales bacterium]|nr:tetratricopeptide repeat protein [Flavobacteriales bacterium]